MPPGKNTDDILRCAICYERMTLPRMLIPSCQHVYCLNCLANMVSTSLEKDNGLTVPVAPVIIKCPKCQSPYEIKLVNDIQSSLFHNELIELEPPQTNTQIPKCACIDGNDVIYECISCEKQYCEGCFKKEGLKNCKEAQHCIAAVEDGENFLCFEHKISLKYYCISCQSPICVDCFLKDHRGHQNKRISKIGEELKHNVGKCKSLADGNNEDLENLEKDAENIKGNLEESFIEYLERSQYNIHGIVSYLFDKAKEDALGQIEARKAKIDLDLIELGHQLNADQTTGEINHLHAALKKIKNNDPKILKFAGQISGRLTSCNEQERNVKSVQCSFGDMKKQNGLQGFEIPMSDAFNTIRSLFPNLHASYMAEPESFYREHFKMKYLNSGNSQESMTDQIVKQTKGLTLSESDKSAKTTRLANTESQPLQSAQKEKPEHGAAAESQSSIVKDGKQNSPSPNKQEMTEQKGNAVRMRNPSPGSSGLTLSESDTSAKTTRLANTEAHPLQGAKEEKPEHFAAAESQSSIVKDGKQNSPSPNKQEMTEQKGNAVRMRNPSPGSSGAAPPHTNMGRKDTDHAWSTSTLSELPNEHTISQRQRSKSSFAINQAQQFSSQGNQAWQGPESNRALGRGATRREAAPIIFRTPLTSTSQPRTPLNSSTSPPYPLMNFRQQITSPPYQRYYARSSPTSPRFVHYSAPHHTHPAVRPATFNDAPASGERNQRRNKVTIKDQDGKDVTDEVLKRAFPNKK